MAGGDGEGATQFHDYEGGGMGEGEGSKDVSDKIENEDQVGKCESQISIFNSSAPPSSPWSCLPQVEDTFREGEEKEEQQDKEKIKAEDNAIEMSEDFDGQMHDGDEGEQGWNKSRRQAVLLWISLRLPAELAARLSGEDDDDSSKEDEQEDELDKKMGDLGDGQTETLDERLWGDKEDEEEEEEASEKEEESGQGMDQVEEPDLQGEHLQNILWGWFLVRVCVSCSQGQSELVAKDDNLHAADPNKDKRTEDKDQDMDTEEKEKINEQGDQVTFIASPQLRSWWRS